MTKSRVSYVLHFILRYVLYFVQCYTLQIPCIQVHHIQSTDYSRTNCITNTILLQLRSENFLLPIVLHRQRAVFPVQQHSITCNHKYCKQGKLLHIIDSIEIHHNKVTKYNRTFRTLVQQLFPMNLNHGSSFISR